MLPSGRAQDCTQVVPTALEDLELEERVRDLCFDNSELVNGACTYPNQAEAGSARPPPGLRERALGLPRQGDQGDSPGLRPPPVVLEGAAGDSGTLRPRPSPRGQVRYSPGQRLAGGQDPPRKSTVDMKSAALATTDTVVSIVTPSSNQLFKILDLEVGLLNKDPADWEKYSSYQSATRVVRELRVVSDFPSAVWR